MKGNFSLKLKKFFIQYSIGTTLLIIAITLCIFDTTLLSVRNIRNIISDLAPLLLMSAGMALCLFSGHVDLSAGAVAALSGVITGALVQRADIAGKVIPFLPALPSFVVIPIIIALFYALGMLYGIFLHKLKIPSWFLTLAISSVMMGIGYMFVSMSEIGTMQVTGFSNQFLQFGVGYIGSGPTYSIPLSIIISIVVLVILSLYLQSNNLKFRTEEGSIEKRNSKKNIKLLYGCSTALFSLAGIMITARNGIATPTIGFGLTSDALAICLIGGFSLKGGHGSIKAVCLAAIIYTTLIYCVTFIGLNEYISLVIRGIVLVCAFVLESYIQNSKKAKSE